MHVKISFKMQLWVFFFLILKDCNPSTCLLFSLFPITCTPSSSSSHSFPMMPRKHKYFSSPPPTSVWSCWKQLDFLQHWYPSWQQCDVRTTPVASINKEYHVFSDWVKVKMKGMFKSNDYYHWKKDFWRKIMNVERLRIWEEDTGNQWYKVPEE